MKHPFFPAFSDVGGVFTRFLPSQSGPAQAGGINVKWDAMYMCFVIVVYYKRNWRVSTREERR